MFSAGDTFFNITLDYDGLSHHLPVVKPGTLASYMPSLCQYGLNQEKLCDANVQLTYHVYVTKEKR